MIVEMAGRPAEHLKEMLGKHIGVLEDLKDVEVNSIKVHEPKEIEMENVPKGMFTCFAEADFNVELFSRLTEIVFDFMPSSIEVIDPAKVTLDGHEASTLLNNVSGRMHRYDEIAKVAGARLQQLNAQLQAAQQALIEKDAKKPKAKKKNPAKKKTAKKK